jgi:peroxiredoxin
MPAEIGLRQTLAEMMLQRPVRYRDMLGVLAQRLNATARSGVLQVGDQMPEFVLPDATNELVFSGDLLREGPLVVVFFRGDWCPFCQETLKHLNAALPAIEAAGAVLVAITPDTGEYLHHASADLGLRFHVLSDVDSATALRFGTIYRVPDDLIDYWRSLRIDIDERHGDTDKFLPMPSTFVVDQSGVVLFSYASGDITDRVEPNVICDVAASR